MGWNAVHGGNNREFDPHDSYAVKHLGKAISSACLHKCCARSTSNSKAGLKLAPLWDNWKRFSCKRGIEIYD